MERSILINNSPVSSPGRINLSGNGHKICRLIGDLHSLIQKWNLQLVGGKAIITEISQLKAKSWDQEETSDNYPDGLSILCEELDPIISEMDAIVKQMERIKDQLIAVAKLEDYQHQRESVEALEVKPLFLTWPVKKFGEVVGNIKEAYSKELSVKKCIAENVAHCTDRESINLHKIAWVHQAYIPSIIKLQFESLLAETGQQ